MKQLFLVLVLVLATSVLFGCNKSTEPTSPTLHANVIHIGELIPELFPLRWQATGTLKNVGDITAYNVTITITVIKTPSGEICEEPFTLTIPSTVYPESTATYTLEGVCAYESLSYKYSITWNE